MDRELVLSHRGMSARDPTSLLRHLNNGDYRIFMNIVDSTLHQYLHTYPT